jgi:aminomethyltransferase
MELKKTPLYQKHIDNHARIVDFGGWSMPIEYESILKEAKATRTSCGLFDASHMGEIKIKGKGALSFLQKLTPNDISLTTKGQLQYNVFLNNNGGIIDDLMVYNLGGDYLCIVNASNTDKVYKWLKEKEDNTVQIVDESQDTSLLSLQGPSASGVMAEVFGKSIPDIKYMHFIEKEFSAEDGQGGSASGGRGKSIIISRSGYTGEDGFEIYSANSDIVFIWDKILESGRKANLALCGLGARDILRIEAGYPLYGHEINDETNPLEASLDWVVKFNKEFIAKERLLAVKEKGITRKRVGFIMQDRAPARQSYEVYHDTKLVGFVTSGTYSPNLEKFIGMAYVDITCVKAQTPIEIKIRDKFYKAKITKFNFITATAAKK